MAPERHLLGRVFLALCATATALSALYVTAQPSGIAAAAMREFQGTRSVERRRGPDFWGVVRARVIATGIPGAGAVSEVGDFLTGSPLHDRSAFAAFAQPGRVLDPTRVLVASTSNFGAPLARAGEPEGSILSVDAAANAVKVPAGFAAAGGQASTADGSVQVYAGQSPAFLNGVTEPQAATQDLPSVSLPLGISLNNGNGRPWIANAPNGARGNGTITVLDPQGFPLAGAPNPVAGGVFSGNLTNRHPNSQDGLTSASLGTAIITKSPDLTGRAVFAAVQADGSVVQVNVLKGVDALAPPGSVMPVAVVNRRTAESAEPRTVARKGIVFNWVPTRNLFIADPEANRIVVLDLTDDGIVFSATRRVIAASELNLPIDLAPTTREVASGSFASNTTLGGGSDLYVLNRGNNTILRMTIDGDVIAERLIGAEVPAFRVNGIAVSSDSQTVYVTATTPQGGVLLAVPAFGGASSSTRMFTEARAMGAAGNMTGLGTFLFSLNLTPDHGLGPLFNAQSCAGCHSSPFAGGMGLLPKETINLVGRLNGDGTFDPLIGEGGPTARVHSITELGQTCGAKPGIPSGANVVSLRSAMTLRGAGLLDTIAEGDLLANMAAEPAAVRGRPNVLSDGRLGKFGWKADVATLVEFMGLAFRNEMGVTNPLQPRDEVSSCSADLDSPEVDAFTLQAAAKFLNTIDPPAPTAVCTSSIGAAVFQSIGCADCHTPTLPGPGARVPVPLYSDLLLHDMGPGLADQMQMESARGQEWRSMPLWRISERGRFLHDGRATTLTDAISSHDGQAHAARNAFFALDPADQQALLAFLGCI